VVDPSHAVRARLVADLRDEGLIVVEAETHGGALAVIAHAEAIVVDVMLPDLRGPDVVVSLRAAAPSALLVVFTNAAEYRRHCLLRGADFFLDKSREFERLISTITGTARPR